MTAGFESLLSNLARPEVEIPRADLRELSDLSKPDLDKFNQVWMSCSSIRRRTIMAQLGELANEHIELIFDQVNRLGLADPDSRVRELAIANLWEYEGPDLAPQFIHILETDPSHMVRAQAARALGRFVYLGEMSKIPSGLHSETENALLKVLEGPEEDSVQHSALESLGHSSREEASSEISRAYASDDLQRRRAAVIAMGRSYDTAWLEHVEMELRSPDPAIRTEAARAAGELEANRLASRLVEMLDDATDSVRHAAIWALGQIGGDQPREALISLSESDLPRDELDLVGDALDHISFLDSTPDLGKYEPDDEIRLDR